MASGERPVLWHLKVSHYSEKVRWALDFKGVAHERRTPPPGAHMVIALAKTQRRVNTFPLLELDGVTYGDSTDAIAALEELRPEPPLYPHDPGARRRALELEDFFDEEIGPHARLLGWHEAISDNATIERMVAAELPGPLRPARRPAAWLTGRMVHLRYGVRSHVAAEEARERLLAGLDRIEAELDGGDYMAGGSFSVADLTAAALMYPLVLPDEGPSLPAPPPGLSRFRDSLAERPGFRWVAEMFRRHRHRGRSRPGAGQVGESR